MIKNNKKGFIALLLNPLIILSIFLIIILLLVIPSSPFKLAILSSFEFAGFTWQDNKPNDACGLNDFSSSVARSGDFVEIKVNAGAQAQRYIETDITGIDEILIIYEGYGSASAACAYGNSGYEIFSTIKGTTSGSITNANGANTQCSSGSSSSSMTFAPAIWKFKNNFDGTWSTMQSLNVGDIFVVKDTKPITGNAMLRIGVSAGGGCGSGGSASSYIKIYNIVRKENAFAVCKADEYLTTDTTGKQICKPLSTIVLNSEEAIKESFDEKLARVTAELEAKNAGLTADIEVLKQQLAQQQTAEQITSLQQQIQQLESELATASDKTTIQTQIDALKAQQLAQQGISQTQVSSLQQQITQLESQLATATDKTSIQYQIDLLRTQQLQSSSVQDQISALQSELKETKAVLADVQAGDKNVINTIEAQEQFKKPNFIKELWNKIIAWIKGLFM